MDTRYCISQCLFLRWYAYFIGQKNMKVIKGKASAITCVGSNFTIVDGGLILQTIKKQGAAYDSVTSVVDGVAVVYFKIDTTVGTLEVEALMNEWRDISESRGFIDKAKAKVVRVVDTVNSFVSNPNGSTGCCGN